MRYALLILLTGMLVAQSNSAKLTALVESTRSEIEDWQGDEQNAYLGYYEAREHAKPEDIAQIESDWQTQKAAIRSQHLTPALKKELNNIIKSCGQKCNLPGLGKKISNGTAGLGEIRYMLRKAKQ